MGERGPQPKYDITKLLKLTVEQMEAIQAFARAHGVSDSEAMRVLIEAGLAALAKPKNRKAKPTG